MGEEVPKPPDDSTSLCLPPGSLFYPSEQQLVSYYLTSKNNGTNFHGMDVIKEMDLYNFDPFNLPEIACFQFGGGGRRRHWFCYVARAGLRESGRRRAAGSGYWKKRRRVRDVVGAGAGKAVVGTRQVFYFYLGDSPKNAVRTHWVMYEYALIDRHLASFVLCRVFYKSHMRRNFSEHIISSCGEGSVTTVRHIGVQFDGAVTSVSGESEVHDKKNGNGNDEILKISTELVNSLDKTISHEPVSEQDLVAILEEDFIELDDLLCPLPGTG